MTFPGAKAGEIGGSTPSCKICPGLRTEISGLKSESDRLKLARETANERMSELETHLLAASGATIVGREIETIKKLQKADLTQRRDLDQCYDEISRLNQEVMRLERICREHKVSTARPAVPDAGPTKPAMGWGAFTGSQGTQT